MGKVYLLNSWGNEVFKVGITKGEIAKRIKQLNTGNSSEIVLVNYYESENYRKIENLLHKHYKTTHQRGEWFALSSENVIGFKEKCKTLDEMIIMMKEENPFFK